MNIFITNYSGFLYALTAYTARSAETSIFIQPKLPYLIFAY